MYTEHTSNEKASTLACLRWVRAALGLAVVCVTATWSGCSALNADAQPIFAISSHKPLVPDVLEGEPSTKRLMIYKVQTRLAALGYFLRPFTAELDDRTRSALGAFQERAGLKVTYAVDKETQERLTSVARALEGRPTTSSYEYRESRSANTCGQYVRPQDCVFVKAEGSWLHPDLAPPVRTNLIECDVAFGTCRDAQADIRNVFGSYLSIQTQDYEIERVTSTEIVTRALPFACVQYVLRVNRVLKTVSQTRSTTRTGGDCGWIEKKDMYMELGHGVTAQHEASDEASKVFELFDAPTNLFEFGSSDPASKKKKR